MTGFLDKELPQGIDLLLDEEGDGAVPAERRPWRRLALCYSRIAFAVVVRPDRDGPSDTQLAEAKTGLYRYLKRIQLVLLESGLVYPLTCIAVVPEKTHSHGEIARWMSDQDWHRGDFTLYVEKNQAKARDRLLDLLSPRVEKLMAVREEPRQIDWFIKKFQEKVPEDGLVRELGDRILDIWKPYAESKRYKDNDSQKIKDVLTDWLDTKIAEARRLAEEKG